VATVAQRRRRSRSRVGRGLIVVDPCACRGDVRTLVHRFAGHDVVERARAAIGDVLRAARRDGRPFVGVAGGDGAMRAAAAHLVHGPTALLPVPGAAPNTLAEVVGIATVDDAVRAASPEGRVQAVDVGRVGDHVFLDHARVGPGELLGSAGAFARAGARERRARRAVPSALAGLAQLGAGPRVTVAIDGRPAAAWAVVVGNGCHGAQVGEPRGREGLDEHLLDVRVARSAKPLARLRLVAALFDPRRRAAPVARRTWPAVTVGVRAPGGIAVALDGDVVRLRAPLRFASDPGALLVRVPPG
jgi:undecaprenyl-diphosphatase